MVIVFIVIKKNGQIIIPYTNKPKLNQKIILQHNDFPNFNILPSFDHLNENYLFQSGIYLGREQLLNKKKCKIIIRSSLFGNNEKISLKSLNKEKCKLTINIKLGDNGNGNNNNNKVIKKNL